MDGQSVRGETGLDEERQRLLEQLLAEEGLDGAQGPAISPRDPSLAVPLTYAQEVLWLLDRATPGLTAYNTPLGRRLRGALDIGALERSLNTLVARHDALRTVFHAHGDGAVQTVLTAAPVTLSMYDVSALPESSREAGALDALRAVANTPFDLAREPGFRAAIARLSNDDHIVLLLTHHIVSDAWSYGVFFRELNALYAGEDLASPALQFGDYAAWQRATLSGASLESALAYWRERLADVPSLELPTDFARPAVQRFSGARRSVTLSRDVEQGIRALSQRAGATQYMVLLSTFATVLARYSGQDDIIIGSAVAGRTRTELESIVGYFSQALPMRVRLSGDPSFSELLNRVSTTVLGAFEHQDTPLESLVLEQQRGRAHSHAPLFRVVLTMQDTLGEDLRLGPASASPVELDASETKFDLTLLVTEDASGLTLTLWYRTDLFSAGYAERFLGHFVSVLTAAVTDASVRVSSVPLLTAAEQTTLASWNATTVAEGAPSTVTALIEAQAARVPERTAVIAGETTLTYAQLNTRANQLAAALIAQGVGSGTQVGLGFERSADALVALLGILKAGAAYVPLPVDAPPARIAQVIAESGARLVVTDAAHVAALPATVTAMALDRDAVMLAAQSQANPAPRATPSDRAYVLFTSGSTGVPKGVAVGHAQLVHYTRAISRVLGEVPASQPGDGLAALDGWHFGMVSTLAADLGNTSLFPALCSGGTLHVLAAAATTEPARYAAYVTAHPLDVLKATPSHVAALTAGKSGAALAALLPKKRLVVGGEALRANVARPWLAAGIRVLNHYGPTETTVGVLTHDVTDASIAAAERQGAQTVPIGAPLANTQAYIVDQHGHEQPVGIPGELWIGGAGVTEGYLGKPELTAERFVSRPPSLVASPPQAPGLRPRAYTTGDRARRHPDGTIEFLGRGDDQVKVRGYRVELGEIEAVLRQHPGVAESVVVFRRDDADGQLVAYAVPKAGYAVSHSDRPTSATLTTWCETQLPAYMVPPAVLILDALPLTPNGKVDRAQLPAPGAPSAVPLYVAPRTPTETQLAAIWGDVLKRDQVGATDNFLALGGHSLLAIRVLGKISKSFGVRLPLRILFETPTIEALAAAIDRERPTA